MPLFLGTAAPSNYLGFENPSSKSTSLTGGISMITTIKILTMPSGEGFTSILSYAMEPNYLSVVDPGSPMSTTSTGGLSMVTTVQIVTEYPEGNSIPTVTTHSAPTAYLATPSNDLTSAYPAIFTTPASAESVNNLPTHQSPSKIYTFQSPSDSATFTISAIVPPVIDSSANSEPSPMDLSASAIAYLPFATKIEDAAQASVFDVPLVIDTVSNYFPQVASDKAKAATVILPIVTTVRATGQKPTSVWTLATAAGPDYVPASEFGFFRATSVILAGKPLAFDDAATAATIQTGAVNGLPYNIGNGFLSIDSKTYNLAYPTTTTLSGDSVLMVKPGSGIYVSLLSGSLPKATPTQKGAIYGMQYSFDSGRLYIDDKTINMTHPTTTALSDGNVLVVNPNSGIYVSMLPKSSAEAMPIQTGVVDGIQYSVGSGRLYIGGKTINMASRTTATLSSGGVLVVDPTGGASVQVPANSSSQVEHGRHFGVPEHQYIIGAFVPTIVAGLFAIPCHLLASALKEMEPFYQLRNPDGVGASNSLLLDYKSSINVVATFNAFRNGHFLVWCSGLISLMTPLLAPLASETVFIGFVGEGKCTATSGRMACNPRLSVYPAAARTIQGILAVIAVLTIFLAIALARKNSGVYSNPLSIASVAALCQNKDVLEEFRHINPHITNKRTLMAALEDQRFKIGAYETEDRGDSYGLFFWKQISDSTAKNGRTRNRDGKNYTSITPKDGDESSPPRSISRRTSTSLLTHRASVIIYGIVVAGLLALAVTYNQTGGDTPFERFMDSQSFGGTFLFTAVGVGIEMYWALLDNEFRAQEPYRQLLHHAAPAHTSILLAPPSNPFMGLFHSLRNRHFMNASTSFLAILCQPLIVALANIPFKAGLAFSAYRACTYIVIAVLSLMLIGVVGIVCRKDMSELAAKRPDTLAGVMMLLCGSRMLVDFEGMGTMGRKERDEIVRGWGKVYSMGMVVGVDGVEREGVDEAVFVDQKQ